MGREVFACASSASVFSTAGLHGAGTRNAFVAKVYTSAGFKKAAAQRTLDAARTGKYDTACQELHPGQPCWDPSGLWAVMRSATADVGLLAAIRFLLALLSKKNKVHPSTAAPLYIMTPSAQPLVARVFGTLYCCGSSDLQHGDGVHMSVVVSCSHRR